MQSYSEVCSVHINKTQLRLIYVHILLSHRKKQEVSASVDYLSSAQNVCQLVYRPSNTLGYLNKTVMFIAKENIASQYDAANSE